MRPLEQLITSKELLTQSVFAGPTAPFFERIYKSKQKCLALIEIKNTRTQEHKNTRAQEHKHSNAVLQGVPIVEFGL